MSAFTSRIAPLQQRLVVRMGVLFFTLSLLLAASQYLVLRYYWTSANREATQLAHWSLASDLARELQVLLESRSARSELREKFAEIHNLYPRYDVYVLDSNGIVVESVYDLGEDETHPLFVNPIQTKILEAALTPSVDRKFPIYARSPEVDLRREVLFSVARVKRYGAPAYVYVVLEGRKEFTIQRAMESKYLARGGMVVSAILFILVFALGLFLARRLVRRFQDFTHGVSAIGSGNYSTRLPISGSDEIASLGININAMADEIERTMRQLHKVDKWRREMTAALSHDFKGPIASLTAHLALIKQNLGDKEKALSDKISILERNTETLKRYVDDILKLSTLESGETQLNIVPFLLAEIIEEELLPRFLPVAESKQIDLHFQEEYSGIVHADPELIVRAITNLMLNALEHTPPGGKVSLHCTLQGSRVRISVHDTGPGIPKDDIKRLLLPYKKGYTSEISGKETITTSSGLGLAIVNAIILAHGQELVIDSEEGAGSTFSFMLETNPTTATHALTMEQQ